MSNWAERWQQQTLDRMAGQGALGVGAHDALARLADERPRDYWPLLAYIAMLQRELDAANRRETRYLLERMPVE